MSTSKSRGRNLNNIPDGMVGWALKEGYDPSKFSIGGRLMTESEFNRTYPYPTREMYAGTHLHDIYIPSMWGSPAGHLKQYKPFGGILEPLK